MNSIKFVNRFFCILNKYVTKLPFRYINISMFSAKTFYILILSQIFAILSPIFNSKMPPLSTIGLFGYFRAQQISANSFPISGSITLTLRREDKANQGIFLHWNWRTQSFEGFRVLFRFLWLGEMESFQDYPTNTSFLAESAKRTGFSETMVKAWIPLSSHSNSQ